MGQIDIDHLRQWIGKETESQDIITPRLVDEYRATLAPHLFEDAPGAPLALHWCLAPPIRPMAELGPDGHPVTGGSLPPVPLPRRMWAGGEIEIRSALKSGDAVTRRSTIDDVTVKDGRSGLLCFVTVGHDYVTEHGVAIRERQDIVYREAASGRTEPVSDSPKLASSPKSDLSWTVETSPTLLFRYSALTFNGHRIHYDLPYVTDVEFYAGLVVHGPLQASIMLNQAAQLAGKPPRRFSYRGVSPLIAGARCEAHTARLASDNFDCWVQDSAGRVTMKASASW